MVRRVRQDRLVLEAVRLVRLFLRWLLIWLNYLIRLLARNLKAAQRLTGLLFRPKSPNNLFVSGREASYYAPDLAIAGAPDGAADITGTPLLWSAQPGSHLPDPQVDSLSLWRGVQPASLDTAQAGTASANRRFAYVDLLASQIKRLSPADIQELDAMIHRLARKWLAVDQAFEQLPKRNRLDVGRTLRYNIPRYAGRILDFQLAVKERPIPQLIKPAKLLVIGDVSHSMVHYVSIILYFFHKLNFQFGVDSFIFSEKATHSAPFLNGIGTFEEKVQRLMAGARSWNAGTRFGAALAEIATQAAVDENTHVIIATDGKVSLQGDEATKIERHMRALRARARQVIFLTPSAEFSEGASGNVKAQRLGSFKYDFFEIPIYNMGPPLWYGTLAEYADRLYLIRTVQDLIAMTEDLILASRS